MPTLLAGLVVLALLGLALGFTLRARRKGKSSCGCECSACPGAGVCHIHHAQK